MKLLLTRLLPSMLQAMERAGKREYPLDERYGSLVGDLLLEKIDSHDVVEMALDVEEVSMANNVGDGVAARLGGTSSSAQFLLSVYEDYLKQGNKPGLHEFLRSMGVESESIEKEMKALLKKEGHGPSK